MKIISKLLLILSFLLIIFISYLSIFGVETDKFNSQISSKIKDINNNLSVELNKIKLVLDPFNLILNVKTVGSKFKNQNEIIAIESIRTQISLKSYFENKFSIENLEISTNSLEMSRCSKTSLLPATWFPPTPQ